MTVSPWLLIALGLLSLPTILFAALWIWVSLNGYGQALDDELEEFESEAGLADDVFGDCSPRNAKSFNRGLLGSNGWPPSRQASARQWRAI